MTARRRARTWGIGAAVSAALLGFACKGGSSVPPCEEPPRVQVLLRTSDRANIGENGQSWPTNVVVFQLSGTSSLEELDLETIKADPAKALGDEFIDKKALTAYPATRDKFEMQVKPKATHLLVVAEFREPLGTAWYTTYPIPSGLRDAQCSAAARDEDIPTPCVYLAIENSEMIGGGLTPPNFKVEEFEVVCSAVGAAKKKKPKKGPPRLPDAPDAPKDPTPKTPSAPSKPSAPSAPGR